MNSRYLLAALAAGTVSLGQDAHAHGFAGDHMFISTLLIDDPNVADEASLPTFSYLPQSDGTDSVRGWGSSSTSASPRISASPSTVATTGSTQPGAKTANGWNNLSVALKYKPYVNAPHEFMVSVGVEREFARTGCQRVQRRCAGQRRQQLNDTDDLSSARGSAISPSAGCARSR